MKTQTPKCENCNKETKELFFIIDKNTLVCKECNTQPRPKGTREVKNRNVISSHGGMGK